MVKNMASRSSSSKTAEPTAISVDDSELNMPEGFDEALAKRAAADNRRATGEAPMVGPAKIISDPPPRG